MNNQIPSMMRLEDRIKKKWKKTRKKVGESKYEYANISQKEFQKGLDLMMTCLIEALREETAKLQRDAHRAEEKLK